jgi:hypothetical protein
MTNMIPENLFDLTPEQEQESKSMYNGKVVKCLIAPYHSYNDLGPHVTHVMYLFPERDLSYQETRTMMSKVANSSVTNDIKEFMFITTNMNIIQDMIQGCVRILTENGDIIDCPSAPFAANIHTIRYDMLENKHYQKTPTEESLFIKSTNEIIESINNATSFTKEEYEKLSNRIGMIGEEFIQQKLREMLSEKMPREDEVDRLEAELERLKKRRDVINKATK